MSTQEVAILSLHPDRAHPLDLDVKHILAVLDEKIRGAVWCVRDLDCLGDNSASLCAEVEAAGPCGLWLPSRDLARLMEGIYQTIEGEFLAFPGLMRRDELSEHDLDLASFPESQSLLAVVAVDGCYFDVYLKDPETTRFLQQKFPDARSENPDRYFHLSR